MIKLSVKSVKPFFFLLLLLAGGNFAGNAQETNPQSSQVANPFWNQVRYGGSLGLSFGNGFFLGSLAPSAIYDFNNTFSAGLGVSGAYAKQNTLRTTSLGGSLIGMMRPIRELQLSAEYEQLHINRTFELDGGNRSQQYWVPALFLGAGYNVGRVVTGVRYDVLHNRRSFYASAFMPFVSVYF